MTKTSALAGAAVLACAVAAGAAEAARGVKFVDYNSLPERRTTIGFSLQEKEGTFAAPGVTLGERFAGQTLGSSRSFNGLHDTLVGLPTGPLKVLAGRLSPTANPYTIYDAKYDPFGDRFVMPNSLFSGNGAISFLFDSGISDFGVRLFAASVSGRAKLDFFREDGSLVDEIVLSSLTDEFYGFTMSNRLPEIRGVSITTNDPDGLGFSDLKFGTSF